MKRIMITLYFLIIAWPALAIEHKVAAVVNDEVITDIDLKKRVALIIKSSGMENNQQSVALVKGQALQVMMSKEFLLNLFNLNMVQWGITLYLKFQL